MVPHRPPCPCRWTASPGGGCRADPVQVETLHPLAGASGAELASDPQTVGADLRRAGMVCAMLQRLAWVHDRGAPLHPYIHYYNRAAVLSCTAFGVAVISGIGGGVTAL